jgi:hypothetical protein
MAVGYHGTNLWLEVKAMFYQYGFDRLPARCFLNVVAFLDGAVVFLEVVQVVDHQGDAESFVSLHYSAAQGVVIQG